MRSASILVATVFLVTLLVVSSGTGRAQDEGPAPDRPSFETPGNGDAEFVPGQLLVKASSEEATDELEETNRQLRARTTEEFPELDMKVVEFAPSRPVEQVAAAYERDPDVEYAVPDFVRYPAAEIPNDPLFSRQWGLHNLGGGRPAGITDADIDAPEAWQGTKGEDSTVVAVVDTGVDINHPDLEGRIWTNPEEVSGDGRDNDGNGYVDDANGWNFYGNNASVYEENHDEGHGTHVAGTVAAAADNGRGVSGVAPGARIMPLKVCGPAGCPSSAMIDAFEYAASKGVKIVNASLGGGEFSEAERDAIETARGSGVLFIFPAGNSGGDNDAAPFYPASYDGDNIISVAASDSSDGLADFSNYGASSVDLAAPGVGVLSTGTPRTSRAPVAVRVSGRSIYAGFGLEQIGGSEARRDFLSRALTDFEAISSTPVLLVDDDGGDSHENRYREALNSLGYADVTTRTVAPGSDGPDAGEMNGKLVIWFTGAAHSDTLRPADQANLGAHLDGGGRLLLMGQDIGYDVGGGRPGSAPTEFYSQKLGATLVDDGFNPGRVGGNGVGPFGGVESYSLIGGDSADYERYIDRLGYYPGASAALLSLEEAETYRTMSGTSMAAPHVSGVAALLGSRDPSAGYSVLKPAILGSAEKKPAFEDKTATGGRLNAAASLATLPEPTKLALRASRKLVLYNGKTLLAGRLGDPDGSVAGGRVEVWRSTNRGRHWRKDGIARYHKNSGTYRATRRLTSNTLFQLRFVGNSSHKASRSPRVAVRARAYLSRPMTPSRVKKGAAFTVRGYLKPRHPGMTRLDFYYLDKGKWRPHGSVKARNARYRDHTSYRLRHKLPRAGRWYVRAYHADRDHAPTKSRPKHFVVRKPDREGPGASLRDRVLKRFKALRSLSRPPGLLRNDRRRFAENPRFTSPR